MVYAPLEKATNNNHIYLQSCLTQSRLNTTCPTLTPASQTVALPLSRCTLGCIEPHQEFRLKAEMENSTLVSVDDIMEMLPRLGEPLPEAEVIVPSGIWNLPVACTYGPLLKPRVG